MIYMPLNNMIKTGRVYKIVCSLSDDIYVGSTLNELKVRWQGHKYSYSQWLSGKHKSISVYPLFSKYGIQNLTIILIKEYQVCDKEHLRAYEQLWISKTRCVNMINPFCIKRLNQRKYAALNKEKLASYHKEWASNNKDKIQVSRSNRQASINEKNKEKIRCVCGTTVSRRNQAAHRKSKQHIDWTKRTHETSEEALEREQQARLLKESQKKKRHDYHKEWRDKNKNRIATYGSEKVECACGSIVLKRKQSEHQRTKNLFGKH